MILSKRTVLSLIFAWVAFNGFSQEQLGLRLGNYSGINGTLFNPASGVSSPLRWDVNVIAAGAFVENNYVFVRDASLLKILRNKAGFTFAGDINSETGVPPGRLVYDFTRGDRRKEAYTNVFFTGPSALFHVKEHTFGIFMNMRSVVSTNRVSPSTGYYDVADLQRGDMMRVEPFKVAAMVWSEVGVNYGRQIFTKGKHTVNVGASLKFLQGYEGAYFQNHAPVNITMNIDSMRYNDARVTFGMATGADINGDPYEKKIRGYGASMDIGAIYFIGTDSKNRPYDWKFGASLLDFGKIAYNRDANAHEITTNTAFDFVQAHYLNLNSLNAVFEELSIQSLDDSTASYVNDRFGMWTPAGIAVTAERAITNNIYINAAVVRRLRFRGAVPERENIWSITPRFEHRWFEVSVPLVLYNDKDFRLGTAVRLGPLVIGSDNLTSWFGSHDFTGSDVYIALKINPFSLKRDVVSSNTIRKKGAGRGMRLDDCFEFRQ